MGSVTCPATCLLTQPPSTWHAPDVTANTGAGGDDGGDGGDGGEGGCGGGRIEAQILKPPATIDPSEFHSMMEPPSTTTPCGAV